MVVDSRELSDQQKELVYEFHPLANIFPLMSREELYELAKDISKNGLLEPIVLLEGKILDGRNRYKACLQINEKPIFVEFDNSRNPYDFVISLNLHRRHLNSAQRGELALIALKREREKDSFYINECLNNQSNNLRNERKNNTDLIKKIANQYRVSNKTLFQIEKITTEAQINIEIKEKWKQAKEEKLSIRKAYNSAKKSKDTREILFQAKEEKEISGKIIHNDFFIAINTIPDDSVDLLFVDPPYNVLSEEWDTFENIESFLSFSFNWLNSVLPKVKDTGRVYICSSQKHKYLFYQLLKDHYFFGFNFGQEIIWHYKNNMRISSDNEYHYSYDPIFYLYGKEAKKLNFPHEAFKDGIMSNVWTITTPQSNFSEGKFHPAQKPLELLNRIILTGSKENDLVLDPFAGSGTTGVICEKLSRNYILIERDAQQIEICKGRIKGVVV